MKLSTYLRTHAISAAAFSREIGVSKSAVTLYVNELRIPRPGVMARIQEKTGGAVQPNDFFLSDETHAA